MRITTIAVTTALALAGALGAQQQKGAPAAPRKTPAPAVQRGPAQQKSAPAQRANMMADMMAMHCGEAAMPGMSGEQRMQSRRDSMKPGMQHDMPMMPGGMGRGAGQGMGQGGMQGMMEMMGPPMPGMILQHHTKDLSLSATQVSQLQALQKQWGPACVAHMQAAMNTMRDAGKLLDAASPDWNAYTAKVREATGHMAEGHVAMAKGGVAARDVLTPAQRKTLADRMAEMHKQ